MVRQPASKMKIGKAAGLLGAGSEMVKAAKRSSSRPDHITSKSDYSGTKKLFQQTENLESF